MAIPRTEGLSEGSRLQLTWSCPAHRAGRQAASNVQSSRTIRKRRRGLREGKGCTDLVLLGVPEWQIEVPVPPPFSLPRGQPWHQVALAATSLVGERASFSALSPPLKLGRKCHISWGGGSTPHSDPSPKPRKRSDFHTAKKGHRWSSPRMAEFLPSHPQFTLLLPPTSSPSLSGFSPQLCCSPSLALKGGGRGPSLTRNQQQCLRFKFFPLADKY